MPHVIDIQLACAAGDAPDHRVLNAAAGAALAELDPAEVTLRIVDEDEGRALNRTWRGADRATNVLSFPAELPEVVGLPLLGDVVLCAPVIAREAAEQGKPPAHHWAHLVIHGILHLRGFDHISPAEADIMERCERELLAGLGIPDPYREPDSDAAA